MGTLCFSYSIGTKITSNLESKTEFYFQYNSYCKLKVSHFTALSKILLLPKENIRKSHDVNYFDNYHKEINLLSKFKKRLYNCEISSNLPLEIKIHPFHSQWRKYFQYVVSNTNKVPVDLICMVIKRKSKSKNVTQPF